MTFTTFLLAAQLAALGYLIAALPKTLENAISAYYGRRMEEMKATIAQQSLELKMRFEQQFMCKKTAYDAIWRAVAELQIGVYESSQSVQTQVDALDRTIRTHHPFMSEDVLVTLGKLEPLLTEASVTSIPQFDKAAENVARAIRNDLFGER